MPKIIQMPRRTQPESLDRTTHRSMVLPDVYEESESLAKIQRWLQMAPLCLVERDAHTRGCKLRGLAGLLFCADLFHAAHSASAQSTDEFFGQFNGLFMIVFLQDQLGYFPPRAGRFQFGD